MPSTSFALVAVAASLLLRAADARSLAGIEGSIPSDAPVVAGVDAIDVALPDLAVDPPEVALDGADLLDEAGPPTPPHNGTLTVRHRRELGDFSGWQDGRCTWYGGPGGPGPDGASACVRHRRDRVLTNSSHRLQA